MVDIGGIGGISATLGGYCIAKCAAEYADRRIRGTDGTTKEERQKFIACVARCTSPVDLPSREDDEETEPEAEVDDDDD